MTTSALDVLLLAGGCNGSAGMRLVQVLASVLLSPPFQPHHDGQYRKVGCLLSSESCKNLLEITISDVTWDMTNLWELVMINEDSMNAGEEAFRLSNVGFLTLCQDQLSGVLQLCC